MGNTLLTFCDSEFGEVVIRPNRRASRLIFRVKEGVLQVTIPVGYRTRDVVESVDANREQLRRLFARAAKLKQRPIVAVGDHIPYYGGEVVLLPGIEGRGFLFKYAADKVEIYCPQGYDLNDAPVWEAISKCVNRFIKRRAQEVLPRRLESVAGRLGIKSVPVTIGRGRNKLGHCTSRGEIQLSYRLMFYPEEVIDYIICHELAHLTYMNHSPEFHALCNRYCGGREVELRRKARAFTLLFS